jgi:hypothetical protein
MEAHAADVAAAGDDDRLGRRSRFRMSSEVHASEEQAAVHGISDRDGPG